MTLIALVIFAISSLPNALAITANCESSGSCAALTTSEKQAILDIHNKLRDRVAGGGVSEHPSATNMNALIWDEGLEKVAQDYAETCPSGHNGNRNTQYATQRTNNNVKWTPDTLLSPTSIKNGENLAWAANSGSTAYTINDIVNRIENKWFNEYQYWTFGNYNVGCENGQQCGHYTQMVWSDTRYVGCGYSTGCNSPFNGYTHTLTIVCNYFPVGNLYWIIDGNPVYRTPYESGTKASNCMTDRTSGYSFPLQPYNALCGGGACSTMCDGESVDTSTCDGTGCSGNPNPDCNDGTISKTSGRDTCTTPAPTSTTPIPTATPTTTPISGPSTPQCLTLSGFWSPINGDYSIYNTDPDYAKGTSFYVEYNGPWDAFIITPELDSNAAYYYCPNGNDIDACTTSSTIWKYWDGSDAGTVSGSSYACPSPAQSNAELKDIIPLQKDEPSTDAVVAVTPDQIEMHIILGLLVILLVAIFCIVVGFCVYVKNKKRNDLKIESVNELNEIDNKMEMVYFESKDDNDGTISTNEVTNTDNESNLKINVHGKQLFKKVQQTTPVTPLIEEQSDNM